MQLIRPIEPRDYPALWRFSIESGYGFTSLPKNERQLEYKIERSQQAFAEDFAGSRDRGYLFVMEDSESGEVLGTSGIEAGVGLTDAFYHYHLSKVVHSSRELGVHNTVDVLTLCNDYTGVTEICTLFLTPAARQRDNGRLLSRFRFLFMAEHPEGFADTVVAEMRGVSDDNGQSPFWHWLQKHFFSMDLAEAVHRVGMGQKSFIAELMPSYPVYASLLDEEAQAVIGKVHPQTEPALKLLEREGFMWRGYVDPFDAGPTVEARLDAIRTVIDSARYTVRIGEARGRDLNASNWIIANGRREGFRATRAPALAEPADGTLLLAPEAAGVLQVEAGDPVRAVLL